LSAVCCELQLHDQITLVLKCRPSSHSTVQNGSLEDG